MATETSLQRPAAGSLLVRARVRAPRWHTEAWGAIGVTTVFLAITCWWLTQDRSIPTFDAGFHLLFLERVYHELGAGHFGAALTLSKPYPPFTYLIGCLGFAIGGVSVASAIIAENLFFVPLLALGCYQIGKRAFGPLAGLLAVIFALGSPLAISQFHVFMIDAPETAMVAVSVWLIIATENFSRVGVCALAGLAVGLGALTKEPFVFFVAGVLAVTFVRMIVQFVRDGWRRQYTFGLLAFALIAVAVALPWYHAQYKLVHEVAVSSVNVNNSPTFANNTAPARYTVNNLTWYFWNFINFQLYLPLFALAVAGWIWMSVRLVQRQPVSSLAPELMVGSVVGWYAITETFLHDTRYSEPLLVFLAVIATGWIVRMGRPARAPLIAALALFAVVNLLAASFGVGKEVAVSLGSSKPTLQHEGQLTLAASSGFLVGKPIRDGDMLAAFRALRAHGVRRVDLAERFLIEPDFSLVGLKALAEIAGLEVVEGVRGSQLGPHDASFAHDKIGPGDPPPCVRLSDGTGVWIRLGNPEAPGARDYCPMHRPLLYGP